MPIFEALMAHWKDPDIAQHWTELAIIDHDDIIQTARAEGTDPYPFFSTWGLDDFTMALLWHSSNQVSVIAYSAQENALPPHAVHLSAKALASLQASLQALRPYIIF
jgi:hypothetical protein